MKKIIMLFSTLILIFSTLLVLTTVAMASDAQLLQPASTITYNEDLTVNGTGRFSSVYIGQTGIGGVTFFNGTIKNTGEYDPVTFGDDVRIDGEMWRGTSKGIGDNMPLKVSDTMIPTLDNINDLGWPNNRWQNIYFSQMISGNDINLTGSIAIQQAVASPNHRLTISTAQEVLGTISNSSLKLNGIRYQNYIDNNEIGIGRYLTTNFNNSGQNFTVTGMSGLDDARGNLLQFGFTDHPDYDVILWSADIDGGENSRLIITSNMLDLGGLFEAKFKDHGDLSISSGKCRADDDLGEIKNGTLVRGDDGVNGIGLYYCESGAWSKLN